LLIALPKVVIQRAGFDARRLQDLIDPGCDIAVAAEQGVAVGDRVLVPFQISCGTCRECRPGVTSWCGSVPLTAMCGLGPLAGLDGGGFMSDLVLVPYADAMLIPLPATVDPVDRRVLVIGRPSIGVYAAALPRRKNSAPSFTTRPSRTKPGIPIRSPCTRPAIRRCWPRPCGSPGRTGCTDTRGVRFVTGRVSARAVIPEILEVRRAAAIFPRWSTASCRGRTRHRPGRR